MSGDDGERMTIARIQAARGALWQLLVLEEQGLDGCYRASIIDERAEQNLRTYLSLGMTPEQIAAEARERHDQLLAALRAAKQRRG